MPKNTWSKEATEYIREVIREGRRLTNEERQELMNMEGKSQQAIRCKYLREREKVNGKQKPQNSPHSTENNKAMLYPLPSRIELEGGHEPPTVADKLNKVGLLLQQVVDILGDVTQEIEIQQRFIEDFVTLRERHKVTTKNGMVERIERGN